MRSSLKLAAAAVFAAAIMSAPAAMADPYFHRYTDGSWLNAEYNDGTCHYYYSHDSSGGETHVNRYGDCSHVAIGPNGEAMIAAPVVGVPVAPTTGVAIPED
ncbi:MAG: hypothetical protein JO205_06715 [Pseudolabrys sp.]|nr:hypothetical protein [Pseudolabrys sp.]